MHIIDIERSSDSVLTAVSTLKINVPIDPVVLLARFKEKIVRLKTKALLQTTDNVDLLDDLVKNIADCVKWAPLYDYANIQANGYWSIALYMNKLIDYGLMSEKNVQALIPVIGLCNRWFALIRTNGSDQNQTTGSNMTLNTSSVEHSVDILHEYMTSTDAVSALHGQLACIHIPATSSVMNMAESLIAAFLSWNIKEAVKCLFNKFHRGQMIAQFTSKYTIGLVKKATYLLELQVTKYVASKVLAIRFSSCLQSQSLVKVVHVHRGGEWRLEYDKCAIIRLTKQRVLIRLGKGVRCKYILNGELSEDKLLLIHIHGGAWICMSPELNEVYTRQWSAKLPGIPILSIDYSLSPEHKFPVALQEILDVYMWLISDDCRDEVIAKIGFVPERIVVVGDSAGGNLATALTIVLNDIRNQLHLNDQFKMIDGLVLCYPCLNFQLVFKPSSFMTYCDPVLSPMMLCISFDAQAPTKNSILSLADSSYQFEQESWASNNGSQLKSAATSTTLTFVIRFFKWLNPFSKKPESPEGWYACSKSEALNRIIAFGDLVKHPYLSQLMYTNFDGLADVPCHLIALVNDPLLDDSIDMANKWKGHCTLDVLDDLHHGFLNACLSSVEASEGSDLVLNRIKEAFSNASDS